MNYTDIGLALVVSFAISVLIGPPIIRLLAQLKFGQKILEIGPNWHKSKQGTPTMGGFIFIISATVATLIFAAPSVIKGDTKTMIALFATLAFGFIGFIDDFIKVFKKRNKGLSVKQKLLLQLLVALIFITSLYLSGNTSTSLFIPLFNKTIDIGYFYFPLSIFIIVGFVNAVNLTDGLDGLATGVTLPVAIFFVAVSIFTFNQSMAVFSAAVAGGLLGFLIYNFHPAKVFMGDTGSLFLGGAVCTMAMAYNMPLMLVVVGFIYLVEAVSVMLQVAYFKLTGGKRLFKMSPIHHHLEMSGMSEVRIVFLFTGITVFLCIVGFISYTAIFA